MGGFRERSAALTVGSLVAVYGAYFLWAYSGAHSQDETVTGLVIAALGMVGVAVIGHVAMAVLSGREARDRMDERDRIVGWRAGRNAYYTLMTMVWTAPALAVAYHVNKTEIAHAFLAALLVGEIVNYGSRIYYYRRGV